MMPFISIVIPVYNTLPYLGQCLDSVLAQHYNDWEAILVDDGSTDGSGALCDEYAAKEERILALHQPNAGLSAARNAGFAQAQGQYVLFLDSDDFYADTALLAALAAYVQKNGADVVYFDYSRYCDGAPLPEGVAQDVAVQDASKDELVQNNRYQSSACHKLVRAELLREEGPAVFPPGRLSEDVVYSGRLLQRAERFAVYPCPAYAYRVRAGSITTAVSEKHLEDLLQGVEQLAEQLKAAPEALALGGYTAFQFCTLLINWRRAGSPEGKGQPERIKALSFLLKYRQYRVVKMVWLYYRIFGMRATSRLLLWWYKMTSP